jgi:hypothetical protein
LGPRRWIGAFLFAGVVSLASSAEERPVVALPPFLVEEATKGPPWRYAEAMGYEILSRCDDRMTRRVIESHHALHQLLVHILPESLQVKMSVPRALILYDQELQPAASQEVIAKLLRSTPEPAAEDALTLPGGRGFRLPASTRRYSFLPNLRLWDRDGMAIFMIVRRDDFDAERLSLTHDYVSFMVKSRLPALPPWFIYGFLALYQDIKYGGDRLTAEPMDWISPLHTAALKKDPKTAPPLRPLAEFFRGELPPSDTHGTYAPIEAWRAQAVLFVRWGLDPAGGARRAAFLKFVERSAVEGSGEPVFRECLELDFATAETQMVAYLPTAVRRSVQYRPERLEKLPTFVLREASDGQIARLKGDWERLEIPYVRTLSAELAPKYIEQARRTLKRGYDRGERDPRLLASLGLCEADAGNEAGAREYLEAAAVIGPIRPRGNYELARLRLAEFRAAPAGEGGRLSVHQAAEVLKPLFAARAAAPPLPEVYELIGDVWAGVATTPTRGHLGVLHEGVRLFPRRPALVLRAAELFLTHGYREEAAALTEIAARVATDAPERERVAVLQRGLQ